VVVTGCVLAAVLGLLALVGYVGFSRLRNSINGVNGASDRLAAYHAVQRALGDEAFAEVAFRRAATPATRARVISSLAGLDTAVMRVRDVGRPADGATVTSLLALNQEYAHLLTAELTGTAGGSDAGPTLDAMQQLLDKGVERATAARQAATEHQRRLITQMTWRAPLALVLAFSILGLSWLLLVAYGRRAAARAEVSEQLALRDPLTGLGNRRAFERLLAPELARDTPDSAVLFVDLDGFKAINDTWGHDAGDEVLKAVAERLRATARGSDFVSRIGGDEFAVLARPALDVDALCDRLKNAIAQPLQLEAVLLHPSASIGWAPVTRGASQEEVLRAADRGLYDRKRAQISAGRRLGEDRRSS
jgi:diguanylate cyclase (GGDEF)-like protein